MNNTELKDIVYIEETSLGCANTDPCKYRERTLSYANGVIIPEVTEDPGKIFKDCCYSHYVLADLLDASEYKNDYSSFYHQRQILSENIKFFILDIDNGNEIEIIDSSFGEFYEFDSLENKNLKGIVIYWRNVLQQIGEGNFQIIKRQTLLGIDFEEKSFVFTLKEFSNTRADHTVKIESVSNGTIEKTGVSFKGVNWRQSIRVPGFFGVRDPQFEEDTITNRFYKKEQISIKQINEYKFQTNLIPYCVSREMLDFMFMADDIYFTDYNLNNHSYDFIRFGVKIENNEGTDYPNTTRRLRLNLVFTDKFDNNLKRNFK